MNREINEVEVINYNGQAVEIIKDENGNTWIPLKRICENIGLSYSRQNKKVKNDKRFRHSLMVIPSKGGEQNTLCLDYNHLGGWLYTINPNKIQETIKPNLISYQKEITGVINDYLTQGFVINSRISPEQFKKLNEIIRQRNEALEQLAQANKIIQKLNPIEKYGLISERNNLPRLIFRKATYAAPRRDSKKIKLL